MAEPATFSLATLPTSPAARDAGPAAAPVADVARRAVDAVMSATELGASHDQHAVNLQFSVGDADLAVRVEVRGGEVFATFRTESPELRAALAHEWQSVSSAPAADGSLRLASPVFTSNDATAAGSPSGEGASQQRHPNGRPAAEFSLPSALRGSGSSTAAASAGTPRASRTATLASNLHLHAFA